MSSRTRSNRYLNNNDIDKISTTKHYHRVNESSGYPLHLLFIDQQFSTKYIQLYLTMVDFLPSDVVCYIFVWMYSDILSTPFIDTALSAYNRHKSNEYLQMGPTTLEQFEMIWGQKNTSDNCFKCKYVMLIS